MKKVVVKQSLAKEDEIPTEVLADSIVAIAAGMKKLRSGRLSDRALFLLIQDASPNLGGKYGRSPLPVKTIKAVFDGIESLERSFLKKKV